MDYPQGAPCPDAFFILMLPWFITCLATQALGELERWPASLSFLKTGV